MDRKKKFKFDVVIGNPPYQEEDGGNDVSASPIYHYFVESIKKTDPETIVLITPSRWFVGGKGLDSFRNNMINDNHIKEIHDWLTPQDVFPGTNIRGGVEFFVWDKKYDNTKNNVRVITTKNNKVVADVHRPMKYGDIEIFIRDSIGLEIITKVNHDLVKDNFSKYISSRKPFGLTTTFDKTNDFKSESNGLKEAISCFTKGAKIGYVERDIINSKVEWIDKWKILTTRANNIGTELPDDNLNTIVAGPCTVCTETYIVIGGDLDLDELSANNLAKYTKTKFLRYLHSLTKASHDATAKTYQLIPMQNFNNDSDINWDDSIEDIDKQLYKKYNLSEIEINHINSVIKYME